MKLLCDTLKLRIANALGVGDAKYMAELLNISAGLDGIPPERAVYPLTFHDARRTGEVVLKPPSCFQNRVSFFLLFRQADFSRVFFFLFSAGHGSKPSPFFLPPAIRRAPSLSFLQDLRSGSLRAHLQERPGVPPAAEVPSGGLTFDSCEQIWRSGKMPEWELAVRLHVAPSFGCVSLRSEPKNGVFYLSFFLVSPLKDHRKSVPTQKNTSGEPTPFAFWVALPLGKRKGTYLGHFWGYIFYCKPHLSHNQHPGVWSLLARNGCGCPPWQILHMRFLGGPFEKEKVF